MINELLPQYIELMPETLAEGILYISMTYGACSHLCPCGCKYEVYIPFGEAEYEWKLTTEFTEDDDFITLTPSLQNTFECKSHYYITKNKIIWC
jgi:hypothetical protein